jgi:lysophospholipase L1-like esterase
MFAVKIAVTCRYSMTLDVWGTPSPRDERMTYQKLLLCAALFGLVISSPAKAGLPKHPRNLSQGGIILLLGDSIFDLHKGDQRIEAVLKELLVQKKPHSRWTIYDEAHGGEYVGPQQGNPVGVSEPLFTTETDGRYFEIIHRHPRADAVIINYGVNDSKVYSPASFRQRLGALTKWVEQDYPGAVIIFSTTMYVDPKHSRPYRRDDSQVPGFKDGGSRNEYLEAYNNEIRDFAATKGYPVADVYRCLEQQTVRGNWDLRMRAEGGDPREDARHQGDREWFDNIHPNDEGTRVIAGILLKTLVKSH